MGTHIEAARKAWFTKGKALYQRETNSNFNRKKVRPVPFERLSQFEQDYYMACAQKFEQDYPTLAK